MKVAKNLIKILPLRTTYIATNLLCPEPFLAQDLDLVLRDIVVKEDHAAVFAFGNTSRTMPLELKVTAS